MTSDGTDDVVIALDARTGAEAWRHKIALTYEGREGGSAPGPTGQPTVDGDKVYALGPRGELLCLRFADGALVWSRQLEEKEGGKRPFYGFSTAPTVVGRLLLIQAGGPNGRSLLAFDKTTGAPVWAKGDEEVGYQSPILTTLAGQPQAIAVDTKGAFGFLPETGEVLWRIEQITKDDQRNFTQVVAAENDGFLLTSRRTGQTAFYRAKRENGVLSVAEVWRANVFGNNTYGVPVYHKGYYYGFHGNLLMCVEAATGTLAWRSRPPGGRGLVFVDGHLVIFEPDGAMVIVEATPEEYREKARLQVLGPANHAFPSFSDGRIFIRNAEEIAAVAVTKAKAGGSGPSGEGAAIGRFAEFVAGVEKAKPSDRPAMVEEFLKAQTKFPIVEDNRYVHFVYNGPAKDVGLRGSMIDGFPLDNSKSLVRISGTDFFYRSYPVDADARWDYEFIIDYDKFIPDPRNPLRVPSGRNRDISELRMAGFRTPVHVDAPPPSGAPRGRLDAPAFKSAVLPGERAIKVYLPPGYDASAERYPVMFVNNGPTWLDLGLMDRSLDNLIGKRIRPVIVCFIPVLKFDEESGSLSAQFMDMLTRELVPFVDAHYRTTGEASGRAVFGSSRWAILPLSVAIKNPQVFSMVAVHTPFLGSPFAQEVLTYINEKERPAVRVWVDWNRWESKGAAVRNDPETDGFKLMDALRKRGYEPKGGEFNQGAGWGSWRARTDLLLEYLFPLVPKP